LTDLNGVFELWCQNTQIFQKSTNGIPHQQSLLRDSQGGWWLSGKDRVKPRGIWQDNHSVAEQGEAMVWNPFRFMQTLIYFRGGDPLRSLLNLVDPNSTSMPIAPTDHTLTPSPLPPTLVVAGATLPADRATAMAQLGYEIFHQPFSAANGNTWDKAGLTKTLVNAPLAVWLVPDTVEDTNRQAFQQFIDNLSLCPTYHQADLVDLHQPTSAIKAQWGALDDVVMGGVSASQGQWGEGLQFVGNVSTANSGGFASIRTRNMVPPLNLAQWQGMVLQVEGDGQRYKWILRDREGWDSPAYCYSFDTLANRSQQVRVPFLEMTPTFRAKTLPEAAPLNPANLYSMQVMLSKFEYDGNLNPAFHPGPFKLTLHRIGVYREAAKPLVFLPDTTAAGALEEYRAMLSEKGLMGIQATADGFSIIGAGTTLPGWIETDQVKQVCQVLSQISALT
jgi:hypothetical protein